MDSNAPALDSFTEDLAGVETSRGHIGGRRCVVPLAFRLPTFPPRAYEARNLVWKGSDPPLWRTFSSAERLAICGFPVTALGEVLGSDRGPVEARKNALVGQGFHLPFTTIFLYNYGARGP